MSKLKEKLTNRIDNIIKLIEKGEELVNQIKIGIKKDKLYWGWIMYCEGDGNFNQHECIRIGKSIEDCKNALYNKKEICNDKKLKRFLVLLRQDFILETNHVIRSCDTRHVTHDVVMMS